MLCLVHPRERLDGFDLQDEGGGDQDIGTKPGLQTGVVIDDRDGNLSTEWNSGLGKFEAEALLVD